MPTRPFKVSNFKLAKVKLFKVLETEKDYINVMGETTRCM